MKYFPLKCSGIEVERGITAYSFVEAELKRSTKIISFPTHTHHSNYCISGQVLCKTRNSWVIPKVSAQIKQTRYDILSGL